MTDQNRRDFLRGAAAFTGAAAFPQLLTRTPSDAADGSAAAATHSSAAGSGDTAIAAAQAKMRGLMVDAARVPEKMEYYRRVIEFCSDWELNTLHFRVADDQGSALRFASVPDLLVHPNAFSPEQMRSLAEYGASHGVDLFPEVEAFGHTGYITRSPAYAHLLDREPQGSTDFTGVIPVNPETLELVRKLFREVAQIFPSKYLHGGCDEVNWGGSAMSRKALQTKSRAQIWAEYLNALNQIAVGLGKEFIVWGDFVLHKEPEILGRLDKTILIMDWNYWDTDPVQFHAALERVRANGSRGIGAPGLISYRWGARPGTQTLRNIDAFAQAYGADAASLGVVLTNWVPSRYIQNSIWDGFAYAAVAFKDGTEAARNAGHSRFVERHFGAPWNAQWDEAFRLLYDAAPVFGRPGTPSPLGLLLPVPFSTEEQLAAVLKDRSPQPNPFPRLRSLLDELEPAVVKNLADFEALALSVNYLEALFWRQGAAQTAGKRIDRPTADLLIQNISERDRKLAEALSQEWDRGRPANSEAKTQPLYGFPLKDQLVYAWQQAANFSADLAAHPERFFAALQAADRA